MLTYREYYQNCSKSDFVYGFSYKVLSGNFFEQNYTDSVKKANADLKELADCKASEDAGVCTLRLGTDIYGNDFNGQIDLDTLEKTLRNLNGNVLISICVGLENLADVISDMDRSLSASVICLDDSIKFPY